MQKLITLSLSLFFVLVSAAGPVFSADASEEEELPASGVLSSNTSGYGSNAGVALPWGGEKDLYGEKKGKAPITGSVSNVGRDRIKAVIMNNSKSDRYSASLAVLQFDKRNSRLDRQSFSATLKPGESYERIFSKDSRTARSELELVSWSNLTPKNKGDGEVVEIEGVEGVATGKAPATKPMRSR